MRDPKILLPWRFAAWGPRGKGARQEAVQKKDWGTCRRDHLTLTRPLGCTPGNTWATVSFPPPYLPWKQGERERPGLPAWTRARVGGCGGTWPRGLLGPWAPGVWQRRAGSVATPIDNMAPDQHGTRPSPTALSIAMRTLPRPCEPFLPCTLAPDVPFLGHAYAATLSSPPPPPLAHALQLVPPPHPAPPHPHTHTHTGTHPDPTQAI